MRGSRLLLLVLAGAAALAACDQRMISQPYDKPYEPSRLFPNGRVAQHPVPGTVARTEPVAVLAPAAKPPITAALLKRGRERYDAFCAPCHSRTGDGDGMIVQRGFPRPPSYHSEALRNAPDELFVEVITHGYGAMYSYADRVPVDDRWAIAAYIRALQLSRQAPVAELPPELRRALAEAAP